MFRVLPGSFVPDEDQGYFFVVAQVQDAANLGVTSRFTSELEKIILKDPAVQDLGVVNGFSFIDGQQNNSAAVMFGLLKPFDERKDPKLLSFDTLKRLNAQFFARKDGLAFALNPPRSRASAAPAASSSTSRTAARATRAPPRPRCRRSSPRRASVRSCWA